MKPRILALCAVTLLTTSACLPLLAGGAAASYLYSQEKGFTSAVDDTRLQTHIKDRLTSKNYRYLSAVDVSVLQGEVLLTGVVSSKKEKAEIDAIARSVEGATTIYNEIFTDGTYKASQYSKDSLIAVSLRGRLLSANDVAYRNLSTTVVNGNIYLMGLARTEQERTKALHIARTTKGAVKVHNFIRIAGEIPTESTAATATTIPSVQEENFK